MKRRLLTKLAAIAAPAILTLGAVTTAPAATPGASEVSDVAIAPTYERVDHIPALGRLHSWRAVDNDTLIIWATASRPYLIELSNPGPSVRFANVIGISEFGGRIHARFDTVYVDGFRYRIAEIYKLSKEAARAL